jgi:5'-nucleotidase / UDP-sugar diphosphatase
MDSPNRLPIAKTFIVAILLIFANLAFAQAESLTILHLNDTHSFVVPFDYNGDGVMAGGAARWQTVIKEVRSTNPNTLFLHAGDAIAGSGDKYRLNWEQPANLSRGLLAMKVLNWLECDAMVLGNHEFDYGRRWLRELLAVAEFPILSANILDWPMPAVHQERGQLVAQPYVILDTGTIRVGVLGLTTKSYMQSTQVKVEDHIMTAIALIPEIESQTDLVVVLSHLGHNRDVKLANETDGIDVIIGGHSHDLLRVPKRVGQTLVTQAGEYGVQMGKLDLLVEGGVVVDYSYELISISENIAENPAVASLIESELNLGVLVDGSLEDSDDGQSSIGNLATHAALQTTGADLVLLCSGAMEGALNEGAITVATFGEVFWPARARTRGPEKDLSENQILELAEKGGHSLPSWAFLGASDGLETLVAVELTGAEILELLDQSESKRGTPDYLQVSGNRIARLNGSGVSIVPPFAADLQYTVVVNLSLAIGQGEYEVFMQARDLRILDLQLGETVEAYIRQHGVISAKDYQHQGEDE